MARQITLAPRVEFTPLDTGEYKLTLIEIKDIVQERDTTYSKKGDVRLEFHWEVEVPGSEPEQRRSWFNIPKTFSKKSPFVAVIVALGLVTEAEAIENGTTFDLDAGLGRSCIGIIVKKLKEGTNEWIDEITGFMPLSVRPKRRVVAAPQPMTIQDDDADIPF